MSNLDLEGKTDFLINAIIECLDVVCPIEKRVIRDKPTNYWTTTGIRTSAKINEKLYRHYKKTKNHEDRVKYKERKKILDRLVRAAKNLQIKSELCNAGTDAREIMVYNQ